MNIIRKNPFKKFRKNDNSDIFNENLFIEQKQRFEKKISELDEHIALEQSLGLLGSWIYDIQKKEITRTKGIYNLLECSPHNLGNKLEDVYSFVHPNDLELIKVTSQKIIEGTKYDITYRIITSNKIEKVIHEKTSILLNSENKPIKVFGIMQDITQQKIIENHLKELGNHLNQAQIVSGIGSWKYDIVKDKFWGSPEMYTIYGIDIKDFSGDYESTLQLVHPEDQYKIVNAMKKHLSGKPCEFEYRIPHKDGSTKHVIGKGVPKVNHDGQVVSIIGTIQDITEKKILEKQLERSNKNLIAAQKLAGIGSWEFNRMNNNGYWSEETGRIFGVNGEKRNLTYDEFIKPLHPEDQKKVLDIINNSEKAPNNKLEFRIIRPNGAIRNLYALIEYIFDQNRQITVIYGTIQDITVKKKLQQEIKRQKKELSKIQKRFRILVQESSDVFEIIDSNGTLKYISEASEKVIGYKPKERIGKNIYDFYKGKQLDKLKKMIEVANKHPSKVVEGNLIFINKLGNEIYLDVQMKNLTHEPSIKGIVINFRDITKRVEMEKKMAYMSTHDALTSLPNHTFFGNKLRIEYESSQKTHKKFAVMMLDIDGIKNINYSLGYEIGNQLILAIVKKLKKIPHKDLFISRYSDDSFAMIVKDFETYEKYVYTAQNLIKFLISSYKIGNYELDITANIGICVYPDDADDIESLKKNVKIALYRAKKEGKNKFKFYNPDFGIQNYKNYLMRSHLHHAIDQNELKIHYQPILSLINHKILAVEALVRWEHPEWGMVLPEEFISLSEETGLIIDIGKWVLREVCKYYKQWIDKGFPNIKVSVNFSSIQFFESNFVDNIKKIIDEFNLDPHFLIMEITESIIMEQKEKAVADIERLQSFGIQIALDDFGTGFSSLAYLNSFNIDIIKLDKSFLQNSLTDETSNIITSSIIDMARKLKIKVVTEGIETWEQLYYLRELNCYAGQGFLYTKPIPLTKIEQMLATGKCKPGTVNNTLLTTQKERRKFYRIQFSQLLEANITIKEIKGKKVNVGNTKVLIENIGPGGLCFISNIKMPIKKHFTLQFITKLIGEEINIFGHLVWANEIDLTLFEYGVEFIIDENQRGKLIKLLNQVQVKMRKDILFADGSFTPYSAKKYFNTTFIS